MLAPWQKSYDKPRQYIKKQWGHFANKVPYSQNSGFSISHVQVWELDNEEGWELKNWCFWTVSLWQQGDRKQSILKKINPEYSLEGLMLKLKHQYFRYLMWRADSLEKFWCWERLKAGGEGDDRGFDSWMESPARRTWVWENSRR